MSKDFLGFWRFLAPWEKTTGVARDALGGWLSTRYLTGLSALFGVIFAYFPTVHGDAWGVVLALVLARMVALDLTTYVLPDIYTVPLLFAGAFSLLGRMVAGAPLPPFAVLGGFVILAFYLALVLFRLAGKNWPLRLGMGDGDWKLLAAMMLHLGAPAALMGTAAACVLWMPFAFLRPRVPQPFGVVLAVGWVLGKWVFYG